VRLAEGMGVAAVRVETLGGFVSELRGAIGRRGPFLIEAVL
jgi:acetolactate synthase I/II/III large subunit